MTTTAARIPQRPAVDASRWPDLTATPQPGPAPGVESAPSRDGSSCPWPAACPSASSSVATSIVGGAAADPHAPLMVTCAAPRRSSRAARAPRGSSASASPT